MKKYLAVAVATLSVAAAPTWAIDISAVCRGNIKFDGDQVGNPAIDGNVPGSGSCSVSATDSLTSTGAEGLVASKGFGGAGLQQSYAYSQGAISLDKGSADSGAIQLGGGAEVRVVDSFVMQSNQASNGTLLSVTMGYQVFGQVSTAGVGLFTTSGSKNFYSVTMLSGNSVLATRQAEQTQTFGSSGPRPVSESSTDGTNFGGVHWMTFSAAAGSRIDLIIELRSFADAIVQAPGRPDYIFGSALSTADMGHSVTWAGIGEVRDEAGKVLTDYSALSASSGYDYAEAYAVTSVPEPETYALMLAGLAAVGAAARRRKAA